MGLSILPFRGNGTLGLAARTTNGFLIGSLDTLILIDGRVNVSRIAQSEAQGWCITRLRPIIDQ